MELKPARRSYILSEDISSFPISSRHCENSPVEISNKSKIPLKEVKAIIETITQLKNSNFKGVSLNELFEPSIVTIFPPLNLLRNFRRRGILEVFGASGTGKTQLVMQLLTNVDNNGSSLYIDTDGAFTSPRFHEIQHEASNYYHSNNIEYDTNKVKNSLRYIRATTYTELVCALKRVPEIMKKHNVKLLIVDSVASPIHQVAYRERMQSVTVISAQFLELYAKFSLPIVFTNHVTMKDGKESSYFGSVWEHLVSMRLWLSRCDSICKARIVQNDLIEAEELFSLVSNGLKTSNVI